MHLNDKRIKIDKQISKQIITVIQRGVFIMRELDFFGKETFILLLYCDPFFSVFSLKYIPPIFPIVFTRKNEYAAQNSFQLLPSCPF